MNELELSNQCKKLLVSKKDENFKTISQMFQTETIMIAGPCAIENSEDLDFIAKLLKKNGVKIMRGGAYKPRTSPYDFQGLKENGLKMLKAVSEKYDLLTVTEVVDPRTVGLICEYVDILQIGSRNMSNFELLKEVGNTNKIVLLKRGMSATLLEFILAAEYIAKQGNRSIILCERGIRSFDCNTRNLIDIAAVPIIKKETKLPMIMDLSHSLGRKDIVGPVAKAALAVGSDGIMVEVHPCPERALSDGKQQLSPDEFESLLKMISAFNKPLSTVECKEILWN